jgi:DNA-binding GntR family transcriptional regulator
LRDITELLIAAFERGDPTLIAHGFQRWLDGLVDAGHSVAVRWIANPFLEAYRELLDRFPGLWVLEPSFPQYLRDFAVALESGDTEGAITLTRAYYQRVDRAFMQALALVMGQKKSAPSASEEPIPEDKRH